MSLQFDGNGVVTFPQWTATGDFSVDGLFTYTTATGIVIGDNDGGTEFLACITGGIVRLRVDGVDTEISGFTDGDNVEFTASRTGSTISLAIVGKTTANNTGSGAFDLNSFGQYSSGSLKYAGLLSGIVTMVGSGGTRTYDTDQTPGDTTLPDTTSSQDGTLSGFTSGGFVGGVAEIEITSISDDECRQRDGNGDATFTISGTVAGATTVEYTIDGGSNWFELDAAPTTTFTGDVVVNGEVDVSVRISNDTGVTDTKSRVKAAACIAAWWQSNEAGRGINNQSVTVGGGNPTPAMYTSGAFSSLADPVNTNAGAAGSTWPAIAQEYSDAGIPVCLGNVALGGTSITDWQKGGGNYAEITAFHAACGGLEFTTSIGGETDSSAGMSTATMVTNLEATTLDLNTDFGTTHYLTYFPVGSATGTPTNVANIQAAFDQVINDNAFVKTGGDLSGIDISSATDPQNDNLHLKLDADLDTAAEIRYNAFMELGKFTGTLIDWETGTPQASLSGLKMFVDSGFGAGRVDDGLVFSTNGSGDFSVQASGVAVGSDYFVGVANSGETITEYYKLTAEAI